MASKRLVMGPSPGTGLFAQESNKNQGRGRYSKEIPPPDANIGKGSKVTMGGQQEEERINGRLLEILERKAAKLERRAQEEEQQRKVLEEQLAHTARELEQLRDQLRERDGQIGSLISAQRDLAQDRKLAAERGAELEGLRLERQEAERTLSDRERELQRINKEGSRSETEWKDQILKLVAEVRSAERRAAGFEDELQNARLENEKLTETAQEVVCRYEDESAKRIDLEERCLSLEEKLRAKDQRCDAVQGKAKQNLQAKQRAEDISQQYGEKLQEAQRRTEEAELRCRSLEGEVQRLQTLCTQRGRRLGELEYRVPNQAPADAPQISGSAPSAPSVSRPASAASAGSQHQPSRIPPPPMRPRPASRPGTGCSVASYVSAGSAGSAPPTSGGGAGQPRASSGAPSRGASEESNSVSRNLPPGAIRRAGSVPVRRPPRSGQHAVEPLSGIHCQPPAPTPVAVNRQPETSGSRPSTRGGYSEVADMEIDCAIPSDPDSSDEEEVLTAVRPSGHACR